MTNNASTESSLTEFEWTRLLGTSDWDEAQALTTGVDESIYIAGYTDSDLDCQWLFIIWIKDWSFKSSFDTYF